MQVLELFAGAGGAALGLHDAGMTHVACVEKDPDACATLRAVGLPAVELDVRHLDREWLPHVCVLWASPPCQPYSQAGKRRAQDDDRNLWPDTLRIIDAVTPRWFVMENVRGLTYHKRSCKPMFRAARCAGCYLEQEILPALRARYPHVWHGVLNAADYGVPQHRRRLIIVASHVPFDPPEATHGPGTDTPYVSCGAALGFDFTVDGSRNSAANPRQERVVGSDEPAPSIGTRGNQVIRRPEGTRCLQPDECAILQGFSPHHPWVGGSKRSLYRQVGNAVPPALAEAIGRAIIRSDNA
jgi:DNA (cytosine-5)-methyltransferase 1